MSECQPKASMPYARVWGDKKTRCRNSSSEACVRQVTVEKPNLRGPIKKGTGLNKSGKPPLPLVRAYTRLTEISKPRTE
ncbi:hypothetical protein MGG_16255 [Pyricularia oryzae 70-15]|uniref:Uncharacterized protein n=1 Tax=Pyricularia oryzae (strain 70-15 / ATCC MYA-4617 / FGSC 8958) TaxID=242507 RepID=G4MQ66_PYRO7|nr:uncharacterized protein MGG_16255 [Pyricularia oryzae 70-15]EHA57259.1 hypothetical protein MGG_16255 [Pyricularia oryzae 70-15]